MIYYTNSVLASIVSIFGCIMVVLGISGIAKGEIGAEAIPMIILGIALAILGKVISVKKANKKK
ncbi:MAG: hypothetical protein Q4B22_06255 [Eubacteriales bacterium]|nr:hypothetical protein [Eubacteriales bacterium]